MRSPFARFRTTGSRPEGVLLPVHTPDDVLIGEVPLPEMKENQWYEVSFDIIFDPAGKPVGLANIKTEPVARED